MDLQCLVLLVPLTVWVVIRFMRSLKRSQGLPGVACCVKCGYPALGLPSDICPECGSDLRVVGTTTGRSKFGQRPWQRATLCLALLVCLSVDLHLLVSLVWPKAWGTFVSERLIVLLPSSGEYKFVEVYLDLLEYVEETQRPAIVQLSLMGAPGAEDYGYYLRISIPRHDGNPQSEQRDDVDVDWPITSNVVLEWMANGGVDVASSKVGEEASEMVKVVEGLAAGQGIGEATAGCSALRVQPWVSPKSPGFFAAQPGARNIELLMLTTMWIAGVLLAAHLALRRREDEKALADIDDSMMPKE